MKSKDETTKLLIDQVNRFETETGRKVKCIRSDNGGEFESKALATFLKSKGIKTKRSLPYHHYQNGAIERYNRSVSDMGRSVLTDSTLPRSFWGFAFLWANYTLNRLPNKEKQKRLDDRATEAHVIGYIDGSKGWMLWIPSSNTIKCSAWARFADDPLKLTTGTQPTNKHVDLNLSRPQPTSLTHVDPALQPAQQSHMDPALQDSSPRALRFIMAVDLGDFTDEDIVGKQEKLQDQLNHITSTPAPVPKKYKDILNHPERKGWLKAIQEELESLYRHRIWTIELVPPGKRVMGARWVFVEKRTADGKLIKLKAR
ncbi:hypothetical protein PCANC_04209 [Puccinia coronata f. sp. avenae]|uniref:Integrase catalytic domain-containing protein n=1 Tax=Puccinia coronata f. sp. avenae TaxID=200324 RepID=A0A2N5VX34_9BASI|nr:hypothetical protein PCANC_04209 [Puccinia coronata f. sp. avenae]